MRLGIITLTALLVMARGAAAQFATAADANPIGTWRGASVCVKRSAACSDESVVYRITRKGRADSLAVEARRVVDGREDIAGLLACDLNASRGYATCSVPDGKWRFRVRHDSLVGQLRARDGTWLRDVHAVRSR